MTEDNNGPKVVDFPKEELSDEDKEKIAWAENLIESIKNEQEVDLIVISGIAETRGDTNISICSIGGTNKLEIYSYLEIAKKVIFDIITKERT